MTAHPHKLMRADIVGKKNVILDRYVPRERDLVREDVVVTDNTVMRDVNADHKKIARSDARRLSLAIRPVKSAELANDVVVTDFQLAGLAFELDVLRFATNHGMLEYPVPGADPGESFDYGIGSDLAIRANFDVILDDGCGMNGHFLRFSG
jgi:hypothetical protein